MVSIMYVNVSGNFMTYLVDFESRLEYVTLKQNWKINKNWMKKLKTRAQQTTLTKY